MTDRRRENSKLLRGDVARASRAQGAIREEIAVLGSGELVQTLMRRNLVDRYVLLIHPLVLGSGRRLFRDDLCRSEPRRSGDHHHRRGDCDLRPAQRVMAARRIVAWTSVTLDGYTSGPDPAHDGWLQARSHPATAEVLRRHLARCRHDRPRADELRGLSPSGPPSP